MGHQIYNRSTSCSLNQEKPAAISLLPAFQPKPLLPEGKFQSVSPLSVLEKQLCQLTSIVRFSSKGSCLKNENVISLRSLKCT